VFVEFLRYNPLEVRKQQVINMAKELKFMISGAEYASAPVKLERKKIYGWSALVATDKAGEECDTAYLSVEDSMLVPSGGYKQGIVDNEGRWVEKSELTPYTEDGEVMPNYPSSFDAPIELKNTVTAEEFLDNDWESVYQLVNAELAAAVGDKIYKFEFSYRGGTNHNDGYLLNTPGGLFLFAGDKQEFPFVTLSEQTVIDDMEEEVEEEIDDLDFSMF
jgi:hypothetical protein